MAAHVFSKHRYVEYIPGNMNVILTAPHGGGMRPLDIPFRDSGGYKGNICVYDHDPAVIKDPNKYPVRTKKDLNTKEIALCTAKRIQEISGKSPHIVINHLHRSRMDPNCDIERGCFGNASAEEAWTAFHSFIERAHAHFSGVGLLLDIHGQVHYEDWIELGYCVSRDVLNTLSYTPEMTSVYSLFRNSKQNLTSISQLISGDQSLGSLLCAQGYKVVPSERNLCPGQHNYYAGGLITEVHGSKNGGSLDAIQVECPSSLRKPDRFKSFSASLGKAVLEYMDLHYI